MNKTDKVHKEMPNTKHQSSNPCSFREEEFEVGFFAPMFQLVTPGAGPVLIPRASYEQTWQKSTRRC